MKKRITAMFIIVLLLVGGLCAYDYFTKGKNSIDEEVEDHTSKSFEKVKYEPGSEYNTKAGGQMDVYDDTEDTCQFDVKITQGAVVVDFYDYTDVTDPNELRTLINSYGEDDKRKFRSERIDETGVYTYSMDDLKPGIYWVIVNQEKEGTIAEVDLLYIHE